MLNEVGKNNNTALNARIFENVQENLTTGLEAPHLLTVRPCTGIVMKLRSFSDKNNYEIIIIHVNSIKSRGLAGGRYMNVSNKQLILTNDEIYLPLNYVMDFFRRIFLSKKMYLHNDQNADGLIFLCKVINMIVFP